MSALSKGSTPVSDIEPSALNLQLPVSRVSVTAATIFVDTSLPNFQNTERPPSDELKVPQRFSLTSSVLLRF
jgi:hypothetical protein